MVTNPENHISHSDSSRVAQAERTGTIRAGSNDAAWGRPRRVMRDRPAPFHVPGYVGGLVFRCRYHAMAALKIAGHGPPRVSSRGSSTRDCPSRELHPTHSATDGGVEAICAMLQVAPSTYYAAITRRPSARQLSDELLKVEIARVHRDNFGVYGIEKVWCQLHREGKKIGRDGVPSQGASRHRLDHLDRPLSIPRTGGRGYGPSVGTDPPGAERTEDAVLGECAPEMAATDVPKKGAQLVEHRCCGATRRTCQTVFAR